MSRKWVAWAFPLMLGYAGYYSRHMQLLMRSSDMAESKWSRSLECSGCPKKWDRDRLDRLTSRGEER